jgi:spore coat protein U-like protein
VTNPIAHFFRQAGRGCRLLPGVVRGAIVAAGLAGLSAPAWSAASCAFNSVVPVSFGVYDVLAASHNINGVGSIAVKCQNGGPPTFVVSLSTGQSNSYASRVMKSGANSLNYNLYTSSGRTIVWGNGTGGSSTRTVARNATTTLGIFGTIPAEQDVAVGNYLDSITVAVYF